LHLNLQETWVTPLAKGVVYWLQGTKLQIDVAEIIIHKADQPNAFVDHLACATLNPKRK